MGTSNDGHAGDGIGPIDPLLGQVLDRRYRIELRLAAGGFGAIYRATHVITGRPVALKVLHQKLATETDVVARFRREAAALAQLRNAHTITAFDFGQTTDGIMYIVMELLQGETLWERFEAIGPIPWRQLVGIMRQVCSSLAEAHALGIVHRDLKPTNIHLEPVDVDPDFVKVLDFGIAKILHGSALDNSDLTKSGTVVGTFDYMAPEQMVGSQTTGQSDIYTLGIVMYEMSTGERPFGEPDTPTKMLTAMLSQIPRPISTIVDAPPELDAIIARCMDKDPVHRFADVIELRDALDEVLNLDETKTVISTSPPLITDERAAVEESIAAVPRRLHTPAGTLLGVAAPSPTTWPDTGGTDPRKRRP